MAEGGDKPATGAEYAEVTCDIVKAATIVMYTEELIEDAQDDPTILINQDVRAAFSDYIDSNALGRNAAGTIVGAFNSELSETTQTVELANYRRRPRGSRRFRRDGPRRGQRLHPDRHHSRA